MELTKEKAKEKLSKLIERFEKELAAGRIKEYNEEATKISFIQPLLEDVLGWNVRNHDEVSPEEKISRGRVDYGLKIGGMIKVFIEVKPIKADLDKHIQQAVRYGYNKKSVPFVLLTDFEGLKLFDVTVKPDSRNLLKGLKFDLQWNQYLQQFEKLWLLSKESVIKGELDRLLIIKPKDRLPVDKAILDDLKRWRMTLAKDIFKNNPNLFHSGDREKDANYLKEITQKILDRLIFMRSCEDRGLIYRRPLKELFEERTETVGTNTMIFLREEFKHYNIIFDSDLFRPQEWESTLAINFKIMRDIILDTYNPYQFDVIPLEVLGNIYEQYLGYTIRLTDHQVRYELKPALRKAGGVYYTPEYIVDYIVENTIGKLLQELSPKKIKNLRILDPACGSGSFLIRAYEEISKYYRNQKKKHQPKSKEEQRKLNLKYEQEEPRLTIHEKSAILREHIFGVDIDDQAVEVTKLSLMLKMLEGECGIIPGRSILPMLDRNIRCGNSLISGGTLELKKYFGEEWYKVKSFNWSDEFRKIMVEEGGFNVVIGNPPWGALLTGPEKQYLYSNFVSRRGEAESHLFFIERSFKLLKDSGLLGYITPNTWLSVISSMGIRQYLINNASFYEITELSKYIFRKAPDIVPILIFLEKKVNSKSSCIIKRPKEVKVHAGNFKDIFEVNEIKQVSWKNTFGSTINLRLTKPVLKIIKKCTDGSENVNQICDVLYGIKTGDNKRFLSGEKTKNHAVKALKTSEITRYYIGWKGLYLWWCPKLAGYRRTPLNIPKIIIQYIRKLSLSRRIIAAFDEHGEYYPLNNYSYIILKNDKYSLKYILGIINSYLMNFFYANTFIDYNIKPTYLQQIPIHSIKFCNPADKRLHDDLVAFVDVMLDLNKKIQTAKGSEKYQIHRQIEKTDREIDDLVYRLYGITEKEREMIEGTG